MKPLYTLLVLLTAICILSSCRRDIKEMVDPSQEGTALAAHASLNGVDELARRSYIRNDAGQLALYRDSLNIAYNARTFEYDLDGKLSRVNVYDESGVLKRHFLPEYNSNGKVIKRVNVIDFDPQPDGYNIYTYDASGKLVTDSLFVPSATGYIPAAVNKFYYTGDNLTEAEFYSGNGTAPMILYSKVKYEYDNGINPLKGIPNYYCLTATSGGIYLSRFESKNNVVREYHASANQPYNLVFTYHYKYNSSNYPYRQEPGYDPRGAETKRLDFFYK